MPSAFRLMRAPSASTCEIALTAVTAWPFLRSKLSHTPCGLASPCWLGPSTSGQPARSSQMPRLAKGWSNSMRNQVVYLAPPQKLRVTIRPSTLRSPTIFTSLPMTEWRSLAWPRLSSTWPVFVPGA